MRIKRIRLQNGYKRFYDLTIDLGEAPKKIVALVGPNGCGKSSILDGMLFLHTAYNTLGNHGRKEGRYHSLMGEPDYSYKNITIIFDNDITYNQRRNEFSIDGKQGTMFAFRSPYRYNSSLNVRDVKAVSELRLNDYGASSTADIDSKIEQNYRRLNIAYNNYLNSKDCKPSEAKSAIIGELNLYIERCLDLKIDNLGNIESGEGSLYFKKTDHPNAFVYDVLSSGEKEVIDIIIDTYVRRDIYNRTIFLFDEPELHINTAIQRKLLTVINELIGPNCQIWITTHSIGFLRALQEDLKDQCQIIRFPEDLNYAAATQVLTPMIKSSSNWRDIFRTALDDLSGLVSPRTIIYCEGRDLPTHLNQERGLDATVFNTIFNEQYYDTLFISSGGNTELDQRSAIAIAILGKVFQNLTILLLKDRDSGSGAFISETDRGVYLSNNPSFHRMLTRWEIENYLFDKEVLVAYCNKHGLTFNETRYNSEINDILSENVKDRFNVIKAICGITTSISADTFKKRLAEVVTSEMTVYRELESCIFL